MPDPEPDDEDDCPFVIVASVYFFKEEEMATKVLKCDCKHDYQDRRYGQQVRLHNSTSKTDRAAWRCTVCDKERD